MKELNQKIKVVHICTSYKGGAGTAAYRIHNAFLENGIDSHFISLDGDLMLPHASRPLLKEKRFKTNGSLNIVSDKIKWRLKHHLNIFLSKRDSLSEKLRTIYPELNCEIATLPYADYNILEDPYVQNADTIHLHWVAGLLDYSSFFRNINKPVIWTLHDLNPFQGIFHYKKDVERNKDVAASLDEKIVSLKKKWIRRSEVNLTIVSPSKWLLNAALESEIFKNRKGYCIPYPLDLEIFSPSSNNFLRHSLNISQDHTVFLFVAQSATNYRKGFDLLIDSLKLLKQEDITLLVIGKAENISIPGLNIILLGSIDNEESLSNYYSIADAFILPSREDNLPNVMLESMACGTPVISFNVGGMAEIIEDGFNGLKAENTNAEELCLTLKEFIDTKENYNSNDIREFALQNFSQKKIANMYMDIYKWLIIQNA